MHIVLDVECVEEALSLEQKKKRWVKVNSTKEDIPRRCREAERREKQRRKEEGKIREAKSKALKIGS